MPTGYAANHIQYITEEHLAKVVPAELNHFNELIEKHGLDKSAEFAKKWQDGELSYYIEQEYSGDLDAEEVAEEVVNSLNTLMENFESVTNGLKVYLRGHDANDGDIYDDDVQGFIWELDGVYVISPQMRELQNKGIDFGCASFVTFG